MLALHDPNEQLNGLGQLCLNLKRCIPCSMDESNVEEEYLIRIEAPIPDQDPIGHMQGGIIPIKLVLIPVISFVGG